MSEIARYRTEIQVPPPPPTQLVTRSAGLEGTICHEILSLSLQRVIKNHGGTVAQTYSDNAGRQHAAAMAVRTGDFPDGVGIDIESDGRVVFRYDVHSGDPATAEMICGEVRQAYATIALLRALHRLGFNVKAQEYVTDGNQMVVIVSGKKWSGQGIVGAVDDQGAVETDFIGYTGAACAEDEAALRAGLHDYDLGVAVEEVRHKTGDDAPASWSDGCRRETY